MVDFQTEFRDAVDTRKGDIADSVGMPDDKDLEALTRIFGTYMSKQFVDANGNVVTGGYLIKKAVERGRQDYAQGVHRRKQIFDKSGRAVVSKDSNMTYVFELPENLGFAIEAVFPSMFKSKKHFAWFKKHFYKLTIGETSK